MCMCTQNVQWLITKYISTFNAATLNMYSMHKSEDNKEKPSTIATCTLIKIYIHTHRTACFTY